MNLRLYDTLTREKRDFVPRDPGRVTMYVCGPTVYGYAHIGNARPVVVFDVLFRLLRHLYGEEAVVYARNVTDVDDKINAKAQAEGVDISVITERYFAAYEADMGALGALRPSIQPKATEHIAEMVAQIGALIQRGAAYEAEGHVLFDTQSFADYGRLSGRPLDEMIAGARVEVAPYKRYPADFVLWKPTKPDEPRWDSPWGPGRPGWHIECSAMIESELGLPIDIHGGGIDLVFPHHENELAQGVCAHGGGEFARVWMHNGFLDMAGEKMSKSLGNVVVPHDLLKVVPGEVLRWALLSAHYRQPLDWTEALIEQSRASLDRLYQVLRDAQRFPEEGVEDVEFYVPAGAADPLAGSDALPQVWAGDVLRNLANDLNTPTAQRELFVLADRLRAFLSKGDEAEVITARKALLLAGSYFGFLQAKPDDWFESGVDDALKAQIESLLQERIEARKAKDWPTADRIREQLDSLGVIVMDGPQGATWRLKEPA